MIITIAVVEDDVRIFDALELVHGAEGWAIKTYNTGEACLADLAKDSSPQCLILDPHPPGVNGDEVARAVINGDGSADIPIIVLTARPNSSVTQKIITAGACELLTKPVDADELIGYVQSAISRVGDHP